MLQVLGNRVIVRDSRRSPTFGGSAWITGQKKIIKDFYLAMITVQVMHIVPQWLWLEKLS